MIGPRANMGRQAISMIGMIKVCGSLMSWAAAPTAMNSDP